MALLSKLRVGTPVRTKRSFSTFYGLTVEAGRDGKVGRVAPYRDPLDDVLRVWVWFTNTSGAWCPLDSIVRRKRAS